jgi:rubrerythrin
MGNIWDVAKGIEEKSRDYYAKLAGETSVTQLKGVFETLSREEQRHYDLFSRVEAGSTDSGDLVKGKAIEEAKDIFGKMRTELTVPETIEDAESGYEKAADFERTSIEQYRKMLDEVENDDTKAVIRFLIGEEEKHLRLMEALVVFSRRPKQWLEDAEFYHLEEY